ncbi:MAG: LysR family transcriptional regulator [Candidatus Odyssella sp.]|nr:LysR family transcriptional regulator [Candidatus Odyssella sp.]
MAKWKSPAARIRITFEPDISLGPGKARLLEGIRDLGSIAAAGRRMGMSYKRAWLLVEQMNAAFEAPLVAAAKGGERGGGAALTETGAGVLKRYRRMEAAAQRAVARDAAALRRMLAKR